MQRVQGCRSESPEEHAKSALQEHRRRDFAAGAHFEASGGGQCRGLADEWENPVLKCDPPE